MKISCRCGVQWRSLKYAHCSACHLTFSTIRNFDAHMTMAGCRLPEDIGLVEKDGIWMRPANVRRQEYLKMLPQEAE